MSEEDVELERKGVYLFGRDISQIPCFRNTFLYGISSGIGSGLVYFMFTSKGGKATSVGYGSFLFTSIIYWFYCRYNYSKTKFELMKIEHLLQKKIVVEGTVADFDVGQSKPIAPTIELPEEYNS